MKLLKLLKNRPFCNDFHFILLAILILILSLKYPLFLIILFIYLLFIYKKTTLLIPISMFLLMFSFVIGFKLIIKETNKKDYYHGVISNVSDNNYIGIINDLRWRSFSRRYN